MDISRFNLYVNERIEDNLKSEIRECLASAVYWADVNAETNNWDYYTDVPIKENTLVERTLLTMYGYAKNGKVKESMFGDVSDVWHTFLFVIQSRAATELTDGGAEIPILSESVINLYIARLKLDFLNDRDVDDFRDYTTGIYVDHNYQNGMTVQELAMLSSMEVQSIYNVIGKPDGLERLRDNKGKVAVICPKSAKEWLERKESFIKTTIEWEDEVLINKESQKALVPVARDGSSFDYSCYRTTGFRIGKKGSEYLVDDFREALHELRKMKKAYWRRPNIKGDFSIVSAIKWEERTFIELGIR